MLKTIFFWQQKTFYSWFGFNKLIYILLILLPPCIVELPIDFTASMFYIDGEWIFYRYSLIRTLFPCWKLSTHWPQQQGFSKWDRNKIRVRYIYSYYMYIIILVLGIKYRDVKKNVWVFFSHEQLNSSYIEKKNQ